MAQDMVQCPVPSDFDRMPSNLDASERVQLLPGVFGGVPTIMLRA